MNAVNEVRTRPGDGICEMEELMCGGRSDSMIGEELRTGATALANLSPMSLSLMLFWLEAEDLDSAVLGFSSTWKNSFTRFPKPLICQNQHSRVDRWK